MEATAEPVADPVGDPVSDPASDPASDPVTDRREQLLDAADRVIRRVGPDASMTVLAAEAGISKPILYRWFGDKQGLYAALAERHTGALLDALRAALRSPMDPAGSHRRDLTHAVVTTYVGFVRSEPEVYRFLMHSSVSDAPAVAGHVASVVASIGAVLSRGLAAEFALAAPTPATRAYAAAIVGAVQGATDRWLAAQDQTPEELVDQLTDLLCRGWVQGL